MGDSMDEYTKRAILSAIRFEKMSHDFYLLAASKATEPETSKLLMKIAFEEFEHMAGFIRLYPDESEIIPLLNGVSDLKTLCYQELLTKINNIKTRKEVFAIAIKEEQSCIEQYSSIIDSVRIPEVQGLFKKALHETEQHLETMEAEYARCLGMVDDSETDIYVRE
jgi:rubrerythrin